jgi:cob(I)alamin adenosyltransferase
MQTLVVESGFEGARIRALALAVPKRRLQPQKDRHRSRVRHARPVNDQETQMEDQDARHHEKMKKIKAARDKMMETKTGEKGLIIVHTGTGKGKSSSGFGMIMRCIAHEMPCAVVQFIKGNWKTGEVGFLRDRFADECKFVISGEGFTWETQDRARDIAAAQAGWTQAKALILDPEIRFVLLDEINIALRNDYLDIDEVVAFLRDEKPEMTHVLLTGRNAKDQLIELADLVTEMTLVKHPFRSGIKAQPGVEF